MFNFSKENKNPINLGLIKKTTPNAKMNDGFHISLRI